MSVSCTKCGGPHPAWDCKASAAKIAAFKKSASAGAPPAAPVAPDLPRKRDRVPDMPKVATPVTSRRGRTATVHGDKPLSAKDAAASGEVIDAAADRLEKRKRVDKRTGDRHRPGYWAEYLRRRRARQKQEQST